MACVAPKDYKSVMVARTIVVYVRLETLANSNPLSLQIALDCRTPDRLPVLSQRLKNLIENCFRALPRIHELLQ
jgi:hypothetical protein